MPSVTSPSNAARHQVLSLAAVIAATMVVAVTLGLSWPLLSLILDARGVEPALIGLSSATQTIAIVVVLPFVPRILTRFGTLPVMAWSLATMVAMLLALPLFDDVMAWFPIRFVLGAASETLLVAADIWVNQSADERRRGRIIGIYSFALSAGFAIGPLIINLTGIDGWAPFLIGAAIVALGGLPLALARGTAPPIEGRPSARLLHFLTLAPTLMLAGLMFGLIDSAVFSFMPLYGLGNGLDQATVTIVLTVMVVGSMLAQIPVGWLSDLCDRRLMLIVCGLVNLGAAALLPAVVGGVLQWPLFVLWGAALGAFYTLGMVLIGARFRGADLAAVNVVFIMVWGIGSTAGPALTGAAFDAIGPPGLPLVAVIASLAFVIVAVLRSRRQPSPSS